MTAAILFGVNPFVDTSVSTIWNLQFHIKFNVLFLLIMYFML